MKIELSQTARISLIEIIHFLKMKWTNREIETLKNDIIKFKKIMNNGIIKHPSLENFPNIKYTLIGNKQVKLFYEYKVDSVLIKLFWHCKQDPSKLKDLLN